MFKHLKKHVFWGLLVLGLSIPAGAKNENDRFVVNKDGEKLIFRQGFAFKRSNVPVQVYLSGTHYEMGLQYGVLLRNELKEMANGLNRLISFYAEEMKIPKFFVDIYFKYRIKKLLRNIPERFKQEIKGISDGSGVDVDAIYAISMFDDLVHSMGCSSILALSADDRIIHGRNEDLYYGMELGLKQIIIYYNPTGYNSFIAISFPGFIGVSTGYNRNGLGYSHHSRYAKKFNSKGYSQFCVPRLALEECSSVEEVISFYKGKSIIVGDAHTWSDRNNLTGCIIETAPDEKNPLKIISMNDKVLWHINKYMDPYYIKNAENKYIGDESFNNARQEILSNLIDTCQALSIDDVISLLRVEKDANGENYNLSSVTRGVCNIDTQQMVIIDPQGTGIYLARNYYFASKSTVYFIPVDFELPPYVYKKNVTIDPVIEDVAKLKESMVSQTELIRKLKALTVKYPNHGFIYFMVSQALFNYGNLTDWAKYVEKAYQLPSSCDRQEIVLEKAKVAFYQKNLSLTAELLSNISYKDLRSFKSRAELVYLYNMYYEAINNKIELRKYEEKFLSLVSDAKIRNRIMKRLRVLKQ
jgi:hypothetical protein